MNVCDHCHKVPKGKDRNRKPHEIALVVFKTEEKGTKTVDREMVRVPMHLCEKCISTFNHKLGRFIQGMRLNTETVIDQDPDAPVGVLATVEMDNTKAIED